MKTAINIDKTYPHSIDKVWRALTEPDLLARWLMPNDFRAEVGHEFTFRTDPAPGFDGIVRCKVLEIEEQRKLRFSWAGGPIDTMVTFELEPVAGGTRLKMRQTGFAGMKAWLVSRMLKLGNRNMYGRRLPNLLNEIDSTHVGRSPPPECTGFKQLMIRRLLTLFPGSRKSHDKES